MLDEYIIMPNHVHLLVKLDSNYQLDQILHSWKSFTSNKINKILNKKGQFWHREYWDHIVRNEQSFHKFKEYIKNNPQKK